MKVPALFLLFGLLCSGQTATTVSVPEPSENVNTRYTIDKVEFSKSLQQKISRPLRDEILALVGKKFDPKKASEFAARISREVKHKVTSAIEKSAEPDHVRVVFQMENTRSISANANVNRLHYHSQLGLSTAVQTSVDVAHIRAGVGFQTDAETTLSREIGWSFVASRSLGERIHVHFDYTALRQKWNAATLAALSSNPEIPGIYRERDVVRPNIEVTLAEGFSLSAGVDFDRLELQFPATRIASANALNTTLRFHRRWQDDYSFSRQGVDAGYNLRVATKALDSDYVYTRHMLSGTYSYSSEWGEVTLRGSIGQIYGTAPLFERFVAGDTASLRGWNRFDLAPLGGNQAALGSVQYRYSRAAVFYDTGGIWDRGSKSKPVRHSVGGRLLFSKKGEGPYLAVAFPLRSGGISPQLMIGFDF